MRPITVRDLWSQHLKRVTPVTIEALPEPADARRDHAVNPVRLQSYRLVPVESNTPAPLADGPVVSMQLVPLHLSVKNLANGSSEECFHLVGRFHYR